MKELPKVYDPRDVESRIYKLWMDGNCFKAEPNPDKKPFSIVMPPPNVTGQLHMGHALDCTLQDILTRFKRMQGYEALWLPGSDHAGIATQIKVEEELRKNEGLTRYDLGREKFLERVWAWKEKYGSRIVEQQKKMGASCDWSRDRFTMDEGCSRAVRETFCELYEKGLIYKGSRIINWCPHCLTALSDAEVEYTDKPGHLWYIRYPLADGSGDIVIATTRPETIMADAAICVNPKDERHHWLRGKKVLIPLINREIPVIEDDYVEMDFGTGCLKVTPAHDAHDYEIGLRHNLPVLEIIDDHGRLNEKACILVGEDRFVARKKITKMLEESGNLVKVEDYTSPVGYSERTDAVIEPKLSAQWFLKMEDLAAMALESVESGKIKLIPDKYRNTYRHWMENAHDWCISRQLWWGQRIPAYYLPDGKVIVEETPEKALEAARKINPELNAGDLRQDEDVLDTWFSSWLWPISVFDPQMPGHPEHRPNADLAYYYPTNDLVTGPDIIFFWVARMIMAGNEFMKDIPFSNVYFTGIVRDKIGRKMSKTLGNSPNPLDLIEKYGADAVRIGMLLCSSAGNDIFYDESQVEQGRNFCNKIWNSFRLVKGWKVDESLQQSDVNKMAVKWFSNRLDQVIAQVEDHYSKFRISDALMAVYKLFWDDYCSWYLEAVKPAYGEAVDAETFRSTNIFFEKLLKLIHPVMPFITEELWQSMEERKEGETIMYQRTPAAGEADAECILAFEMVQEAVNGIRGIRQQKNISPKEALGLKVKGAFPADYIPVVCKMANLSSFESVESFGESAGISFMVRTVEMFVPLTGLVDAAEEIAKLEAELKYQQDFLASVRKKLSNESFVAHAPAKVVEMERKKEADSLSKIESYENQLKALRK